MPTLNELRSRIHDDSTISNVGLRNRDELLVRDDRAQLTPKQLVETKVRRALTEMEQRITGASSSPGLS